MNNQIEKSILLKAPISRVWNALTDHRQFGEWFRVKLEEPFTLGHISRGQITYPGYEHVAWEATIKKIEPETLFSFTWHPNPVDPTMDYSKEPCTLVEFTLREVSEGTMLTLRETGFENIPANRQFEAWRMNENGWEEQLANIKNYVEQKS